MRHSRTISRILLVALLGGLPAACAPPPAATQAPTALMSMPADFPVAHYRQAEARGIEVLRVDPARSLVTIEVHRAGVLAGLGHDHVIASHDVEGLVAPAEERADFYVALDRLTVDEAELRHGAGFDKQPSDEDIAATRHNMLAKVLETERFPFALIRVTRTGAAQTLEVTITLHGKTRTFVVPAQVETLSAGLAVSGLMSFKQSDFGIVPFSIFGGALQVRDQINLRFQIVAAEGRSR